MEVSVSHLHDIRLQKAVVSLVRRSERVGGVPDGSGGRLEVTDVACLGNVIMQ